MRLFRRTSRDRRRCGLVLMRASSVRPTCRWPTSSCRHVMTAMPCRDELVRASAIGNIRDFQAKSFSVRRRKCDKGTILLRLSALRLGIERPAPCGDIGQTSWVRPACDTSKVDHHALVYFSVSAAAVSMNSSESFISLVQRHPARNACQSRHIAPQAEGAALASSDRAVSDPLHSVTGSASRAHCAAPATIAVMIAAVSGMICITPRAPTRDAQPTEAALLPCDASTTARSTCSRLLLIGGSIEAGQCTSLSARSRRLAARASASELAASPVASSSWIDLANAARGLRQRLLGPTCTTNARRAALLFIIARTRRRRDSLGEFGAHIGPSIRERQS